MNMVPDGLAVLGPDCSSWEVMARSVSGRNYLNVDGHMGSTWVANNNAMVSRTLGRTDRNVQV